MEYSVDLQKLFACCQGEEARGFTKLMHMVMNMRECQNYSELEGYLKEFPDEMNKKNEKGWTALMLSVMNCKECSTIRTVEILIDAGCDLNARNIYGMSALLFACENSRTESCIEVVELLINAGCNLNISCNAGWTPLMCACRFSRIKSNNKTVKLLIKKGGNVDAKNFYGTSALTLACNYLSDSSVKTVIILLDAYYVLYVGKDQLLGRRQFFSRKLMDIGFVLCYEKELFNLVRNGVCMDAEKMANN